MSDRAALSASVAFNVNCATAVAGRLSGGLKVKTVLLPGVPVTAICAAALFTEPLMVRLANRPGLLNATVTVLIVSV